MTTLEPRPEHHYHFVTGRLAESAVRDIVQRLAEKYAFAYSIGVMPITVAALMTPRWLRRHLRVPEATTHVILPGYCDTALEELEEGLEVPVIVGPKDCRALAELFGEVSGIEALRDHDIEIIAEINHVPRKTREDVIRIGQHFLDSGADRVDVGCDPAGRCVEIGDYVAALLDLGCPVSIDTFDPWEAQEAIRRGASLVLSVNGSNREAAPDWGCEVVAIPDAPGDQKSFEETIAYLDTRGVSIRLDPILEPIGAGFLPSLLRYVTARDQYPQFPMMMGIGNITELSDVDSAGINLLLMGICQELGIKSVLTTEVINWARSSVKECDVARRLVHYSVKNRIPPKRLSTELVMLRDPRLFSHSEETLRQLSASIKDNNYRLFAQDEQIHLLSSGVWISDGDPFRLFDRLMQLQVSQNVDPSHAFYLGFEMAKASLALLLGKQYEQDQALRWGFLTREEDHHRLKKSNRSNRTTPPSNG